MRHWFALLFAAGACAAAPRPDLSNVSYGPYPRNVLDLWLAKSSVPAPLFIYIHGGGWYQGDKAAVARDVPKLGIDLVGLMLSRGVSVASINYRYSTMAPLPAPVLDAARAVQFLRWRAGFLHLNPARFAAMGTSAGGCTALWLAFHDDLADPSSSDPVARQSTRLCAALGYAAQTSIDPKVIPGWVGDIVLEHPMIPRAVGARDSREVLARYAEWGALYREYSPINHVSRDDPPTMVAYTAGNGLPAPDSGKAIHNGIFGLKLKEKADSVGAVCLVWMRDRPDPAVPRPYDFLLRYLTR